MTDAVQQLLFPNSVYNLKFENFPIACVGGCSICELKVETCFLHFNYTRKQQSFEFKVCADCCMKDQYTVKDDARDRVISLKEHYMISMENQAYEELQLRKKMAYKGCSKDF